jgi:hypothetical protein
MKATDTRSLLQTGPNRRQHHRYHVKNVTWAKFQNGAKVITAQVMDIGIGGLSIHTASRLQIARAKSSVDLLVSRTGFRIDALPVLAVFRHRLPPQIPLGPSKWCYGFKFGKLSRDQHTKLDSFIVKHTIRHFIGAVSA